jgi:hypothetical protein
MCYERSTKHFAAALLTDSVLVDMTLTSHVYEKISPNENMDVTVYLNTGIWYTWSFCVRMHLLLEANKEMPHKI